jgi:hypothetical protein
MRRLTALIVLVLSLAFGAATAQAYEPFIGSYGGYLHNERIIFSTRTIVNVITGNSIEAFSFNWGGRDLFTQTPVERHVAADGTVVWRFHTHSTRWRVHGHWEGADTVHGSICALDSSGACPDAHLYPYVANAKTGPGK